MLLPFEFLFSRGFLRQIYLLFFPLTVFFRDLWTVFWWIFDATFWNATFWNLETVYVRTVNWITGDCHGTKIFHGLTTFLGFDLWIWLLLLLESVFCGSRTFAQDFVSSLFRSRACHLESIYGTNQIYAWELRLNTLEASRREFASSIKDFVSGFYWLVNQEPSLGTVSVKY